MQQKRRTIIIIIALSVLTILSTTFLGLWISCLTKPKRTDAQTDTTSIMPSTERMTLSSANIMPLSTDPLSGVSFVSRIDWLARPPLEEKPLSAPPKIAMIMQTGGVACFTQSQCANIIKKLQEVDMDDKNKTDIAYNWLIGGDGLVYTGRGWDVEGDHTNGYDNRTVGIAFIGNFEKESPTPAQIEKGEKLIQKGVEEKWIDKDYILVGQRQCISSDNPGEKLYNSIKDWPKWSKACF